MSILASQRARGASFDTSLRDYSRAALVFVYGIVLSACAYGIPVALQGAPSPVSFAIQFAAVLIPTVSFILVNPIWYFYYWSALALTQNALAGVWLHGAPGELGVIATESKTISLAVALVLLAPRVVKYLQQGSRLLQWSIALYLLATLISIRQISPGLAAYGRNFVLPMALMLAIAAVTTTMAREARLLHLRIISSLMLTLLASGAAMELLVGTDAWRRLLNTYSLASLSAQAEATSFLGIRISRIGGLVGEPVSLGYLATGLLIVIVLLRLNNAASRTWAWGWGSAAAMLIFAAGTKNSLLMLATAALAWIMVSGRSKLRPGFTLLATWIASVVTVLLYIAVVKGWGAIPTALTDPIRIVGGDSTTIHFAGLYYGTTSILSSPLGHGLGVGGNFAENFSDSDLVDRRGWLMSGAESGIGVLGYQLGVVGLIAFIVSLIAISRRWGRSSAVLLCVWSASALMAESMFGPIVASIFCIGAALLRDETEAGVTHTATHGNLNRETPTRRGRYSNL